MQLKEYTVTIGKIIASNNVKFVSRISQSRICLYLSSSEAVNRLINNNRTVNIKSHVLQVRLLISKPTRYTFKVSNVCPIIPHHVIVEKLKESDIIPKSQMLFIKAGIREE